ncbi:phospholipase B1, membrane-associated-like [Ciona intestinalis]
MEKLDSIIEDEELAGDARMTGTNDFGVRLQCEPKPTSVHELRPQDIDVVGAMGDSITAGNAAEATHMIGILREFRGLSWSAGGDDTMETSITLPNILKKFNPQVKGYSTGTDVRTRDLWFNAAIAGARSSGIPGQARELIGRMKNDSRTNFENDWKVVTIFIGINDLCALEKDPVGASPESYITTLEEGLDILHAELPRTLVNLVEIWDIHLLQQVAHGYGSTPACRAVQAAECNYVSTANDTEIEVIKAFNDEYQRLTEELIATGKYDTKDDFTVVIQPFIKDTVLPYTENGEVDSTYFAVDCFHLSNKGQALAGMNLWNNMLEPVGSKTTVWGIKDLKCPTKDNPYIFTNKNSNQQSSNDIMKHGEIMNKKATTTTKKPAVTSPAQTKPTVVCSETCSQVVPDWGIALLVVTGVVLLFQLLVVICITSRKRSKPKEAEVYNNGIAL